jgi:serine/threonine protein kinase
MASLELLQTKHECPRLLFGGTQLAYMAPELILQNQSTTTTTTTTTSSSSSSGIVGHAVIDMNHHKATNVFSLGVILGEIATCELPYAGYVAAHGHVAADIMVMKTYVDQTSQDHFEPHVLTFSSTFKELVVDCLQRDPKKRPTAEEVAKRLSLELLYSIQDTSVS